MPDFVKKVVRTCEPVNLAVLLDGVTLDEAAKRFELYLRCVRAKYGNDVVFMREKVRIMSLGHWVDDLYLTKDEHLESDAEYNERIAAEMSDGI